MRNTILLLIYLVFVVSMLAEVPNILSYQGRLSYETTGEPVVGTHDVTFRMFVADIGDSLLWEETHSVTLDSSAIYKVMLGSITPFPVDFTEQYWLEIVVDGTIIMTPRYRLSPSPYALRANDADRAVQATTAAIAARALLADSASSVRWDHIEGMPLDFADGTDDAGSYSTTPDGPIDITSGTISIRPRGIRANMLHGMDASDGQILKWSEVDTIWQPAEDLYGEGVSGDGTTGRIAVWADSDSLTSAGIFQDTSGNIGIGTSPGEMKFNVSTIGHDGIEIKAAQPTLRLSKLSHPAWEISSGALAGRLSIYNMETAAYPMVIDSAGNVGIGVSSPDTRLDVAGGIEAQQDITTWGEFYTDRHSSPATAIAYGMVDTDGSLSSGTDNVTVVWNTLNHYYEITIEGEHYNYSEYVAIITICRISGEAVYTKTNSVSDNLIVYMFNPSGVTVQDAFHFVVYKP